MKRAILYSLAHLPLPLLHALAYVIGLLAYAVHSRPRYYADTNLRLCMPELSPRELRRLSRRSVINTVRIFLESPKLWLAPPHTVLRLAREVHGEDYLKEGLARGKGVILICPHLGNWEMVGQCISPRYPMTIMYRSQRDAQIDTLMREGRERFGAKLVPATPQGLKQLLNALKAGEIIGTLPDQNPGAGAGVFVPFFGVNTYTPVFAARLAKRTGATVLNVCALRLPYGRGYDIEFSPASSCLHDKDIEHAAACMNRDLEALIRKKPAQYWWSYNRFRTRPAGESLLYKN